VATRVPRIRLIRAYDLTPADRGYRVLVDGLWPRGIRKEQLQLDAWRKDLAPSANLRKWFGHDVARWSEFRRRYRQELAKNPGVDELRPMARRQALILIYAARDREHNNAVVLREFLADRKPASAGRRRQQNSKEST
jgi:uncharacterized protein YeaO (DUF488 family)